MDGDHAEIVKTDSSDSARSDPIPPSTSADRNEADQSGAGADEPDDWRQKWRKLDKSPSLHDCGRGGGFNALPSPQFNFAASKATFSYPGDALRNDAIGIYSSQPYGQRRIRTCTCRRFGLHPSRWIRVAGRGCA